DRNHIDLAEEVHADCPLPRDHPQRLIALIEQQRVFHAHDIHHSTRERSSSNARANARKVLGLLGLAVSAQSRTRDGPPTRRAAPSSLGSGPGVSRSVMWANSLDRREDSSTWNVCESNRAIATRGCSARFQDHSEPG